MAFTSLTARPTWAANNAEQQVGATELNTVITEVNAIRAGTKGVKRTVKTAAATLTEDECGALCVWDSAAGDLFTLPAAESGLWYEFYVQTTITSNSAKVITASGDFIVGTFIQSADGTYIETARDADGTTHVSWNGNGSTTGGIKGDRFRLTAISASQWLIEGKGSATGTEATPFATS